MTKADLIEKIYSMNNFTIKESAEIVEHVFDLVKLTLIDGEKIKIAGFGSFEVKEKRVRRGRNPQTGESLEIAARRVVTFKPSHVLKNALNNQV
jgi:integration host factor subunit alpha